MFDSIQIKQNPAYPQEVTHNYKFPNNIESLKNLHDLYEDIKKDIISINLTNNTFASKLHIEKGSFGKESKFAISFEINGKFFSVGFEDFERIYLMDGIDGVIDAFSKQILCMIKDSILSDYKKMIEEIKINQGFKN